MKRRSFLLNPPFREIKDSDNTIKFESELLDIIGINLDTLAKGNKDDKHVWVYDFDGKILAILSFLDVGSYFHMDVVAINESEQELCKEVHPGYSLFSLLENFAVKLGHTKIRLDSISERVEYWKSYGYEMTGIGHADDKLGKIYPMEKRLS